METGANGGDGGVIVMKLPAVHSMPTYDAIYHALESSRRGQNNKYVASALAQWVMDQSKRGRKVGDLDLEMKSFEKQFPEFRTEINDVRRIWKIGTFDPTIPSLQERNAEAKALYEQEHGKPGFFSKLGRLFELGTQGRV